MILLTGKRNQRFDLVIASEAKQSNEVILRCFNSGSRIKDFRDDVFRLLRSARNDKKSSFAAFSDGNAQPLVILFHLIVRFVELPAGIK